MNIGDRGTTASAGVLEPPADARTRDRVWRAVLEQGPVSATHLAERLGLTPAAVRRHLDALATDELVTEWRVPAARLGRGRPARRYVATDRGHTQAKSEYAD